MEDWIGDNLEKMEAVAKEGLCDRCLGRMFAKLGTGMTNDIRGRFIRDALREEGRDVSRAHFPKSSKPNGRPTALLSRVPTKLLKRYIRATSESRPA